MLGAATPEQLRAALAPVIEAIVAATRVGGGRGAIVGDAGGGSNPAVDAAGGLPEGQMRAACQNLLKLHRVSTTPDGDGPQGQAAVAREPPRG